MKKNKTPYEIAEIQATKYNKIKIEIDLLKVKLAKNPTFKEILLKEKQLEDCKQGIKTICSNNAIDLNINNITCKRNKDKKVFNESLFKDEHKTLYKKYLEIKQGNLVFKYQS